MSGLWAEKKQKMRVEVARGMTGQTKEVSMWGTEQEERVRLWKCSDTNKIKEALSLACKYSSLGLISKELLDPTAQKELLPCQIWQGLQIL